MDVSIGQVQAQVEPTSPAALPAEQDSKTGVTERAYEQRLQQRRAKRIHDRLCACDP
jgi:hypothetical protein